MRQKFSACLDLVYQKLPPFSRKEFIVVWLALCYIVASYGRQT